MISKHRLGAALLGTVAALHAQSQITLIGAGYQHPAPAFLAPGQVITLFMTGAQTVLPQQAGVRTQRASRLPLPTTLAGFSVRILEPLGGVNQNLPMLSVTQTSTCSDPTVAASVCMVTALRVQIPTALRSFVFSQVPVQAELIIAENGMPSQSFGFTPLPDNVHIVSSCDSPYAATSPCSPAVTHADGTPVYTGSPAKIGETIVLYALGLGPTNPAVPEGQPTPMSAPAAALQYGLSFDYANPGSLVSSVSTSPATPSAAPIFVGLTPGFAGLYQINFAIPAPAFATPPCNISNQNANLTVTVSGVGLAATGGVSDQAQICVDTSAH